MMTLIFKHKLLLLGWLFSFSAFAIPDNVLTLDNTSARVDINSSAQSSGFFIPPETHSPESLISGLKAGELSFERIGRPDFPNQPHYGLYVSIVNNTETEDWVLHISRFLIDRAELYLNVNDETRFAVYDFMTSNQAGANMNILGRGIPITLPAGERSNLYVQITANSVTPPVYIGLSAVQPYNAWSTQVNSYFDVAVGIALGFIFTAFIGSFVLRDKTLFWFGLSSLLLIGVSVLRSHHCVELIQTANSGPPDWIPAYLSLTAMCLLVFAYHFLAIEKSAKWLINAFQYCLVIYAIYMLLSVFLSVQISIVLFGGIGFFTTLLIIYAGIQKWVTEGRYYTLFMLGWLPILAFTVLSIHERHVQVGVNESTLNYLLIYDVYFKILHIFFHLTAVFVRLLDLKRQKLIADTQSQSKTAFIASLSHDIRQPLHTMKLLTNYVDEEVTSEKGKQLVNKLSQVQVALNEIFNGLTDWSQLDAGKVTLQMETVKIATIFHSLHAEFSTIAQTKNILLRIRPCQLSIHTDPILLKRALRNLLSNALKFTVHGGVLLAVRKKNGSVTFEVWDTGCGISETEQVSIFNWYARSKNTQNHYDGVGVGLANVKLIADILKLNVSLQSVQGKGSCFKLGLPATNASVINDPTHRDKLTNAIPRTIKNCIIDARLSEQVDAYLQMWGYAMANKRYASAQHNHTYVVLTDDLASLAKTSPCERDKPCFIGLYSSQSQITPSQADLAGEVHLLSDKCYPAELRAFIRYTESRAY